MIQNIQRWIRYFLPIPCVGCREAQFEVLCTACQAAALETSAVAVSLDGLDRVSALFQYSGQIKALIHHVKFGPSREGALLLAEIASRREVRLQWTEYDWVIPIPGSKRREQVRGFCLPELIFRSMMTAAGERMSPLLNRSIETRPLFDLGATERKSEVAGVFSVSPQMVADTRVLLLDDIVTSGATAQSAADTLRQAGARRVDLLTLAAVV